jgi:hypothetical protein
MCSDYLRGPVSPPNGTSWSWCIIHRFFDSGFMESVLIKTITRGCYRVTSEFNQG